LLLVDGEIVNETVAVALPLLTHHQMLDVTKRLQPRRFAPGAHIIHEGEPNDHFYMIARGHVDVLLRRGEGIEEPIACMGPGQYFGEVSMVRPGPSSASVRAALHAPVEVLALARSVFSELMAEAAAMREVVMRVARERMAENAAHGGPARGWLRSVSFA
jgi:CRP-like cAMP-binding protein